MNWGYLTEFWNSVSSSTLNAWEYTQDWFYNIGNAVAGAVGNLFDFIIHYFNDFLCFINYLAHSLAFILGQILFPIKYIFAFSSNFFSNVLSPPIEPEELTGFSTTTVSFLTSLPYWNIIMITLTIIILFVGAMGILKLFLKT
jgi:hypothetical protein